MTVREPLRIRKALLAGVVALALTGAGTAITWAATDTPSPSSSESAPGNGAGHGKAAKSKATKAQHLHGESVVKKSDGTFETVLTQRGTVDAVSESSVTVKSEDGFTQSYAVNAETRIVKVPAPAADGTSAKGDDGKRLKPSDVTIAEIATGDVVGVSGVKNGSDVTARRLVEGAGTGPGNGLGLGKGQGKGLDRGLDRGLGKGHGHGKPIPAK